MIFLTNKYSIWYYQIIDRAHNRRIDGYAEKHHIIPRCMGGTNVTTNIVRLTAREHFICHWLLTKMVAGAHKIKLLYALNGMKRANANQVRYNTKITGRVYSCIKDITAKQISESAKGKAPAIDAITSVALGKVQLADPRWETGEIVGHTKGKSDSWGRAAAKDAVTGEHLGSILTSDPRWDTGNIVSALAGFSRTDENKQNMKIARIIGLANGSIVPWNKGKKTGANTLGGTASAKVALTGDSLGRISLLDPRWETGEIVGVRRKLT